MPSDELERRLRAALADAVADVDPPGPGPAALRRAAVGAAAAHRLRRALLPVLAAAAVLAAAGITVAVNQTGSGPGPTVPTVPAGTHRPSPEPSGTATHPSPDESSTEAAQPPLCTQDQLSLTYYAGNLSGGADGGVIEMVNTADTSCQLVGKITVEPLDADGKVIATVPGWSNTVKADGQLLSGNGTAPPPGGEPKPGIRTTELVLAGQEAHGAGPNGTCPKSDEVTPSAWRLSGVVTGTVRNVDPATDSVAPDGLYACDSGNGLDLEKVLLVYPPPSHPLPTGHASGTLRACRQGDLRARYVGGGDGGQNHIGEIVVWNTGSRRCALDGPVGFAGYYTDGSRDTAVQVTDQLNLSTTLPPQTSSYRDGAPTRDQYLVATIAGPVIDSSGTMCDLSAPKTAPARFALIIGSISLSVPNNNPDAVQNQVLHGCGGRILLAGFSTPRGG